MNRFQFLAGGAAQPALSYDAGSLSRNVKHIGGPAAKDPRQLKPGGRSVVFCWIEIPAASLPHTLQPITGAPGSASMATPPLPSPKGSPSIGPRCAGAIMPGRVSANADYCGYGKEVLAVAGAQVAAVKDGVPDNKPGEGSRAVKMTLETLLGNSVVLDLGDRLYAVYAHLQPGSLQVKAGDRVRRGQVIGKLGNSGNLDSPHLHFHVAQTQTPSQATSLQSDPVPYVFDRLDLFGRYAGRGMFISEPAKPRERELVLDGDVVRFSGLPGLP